MEKIKKKRENFEKKNIGNYRLAYPSPNEEIQAKYDDYLDASMNVLAYPIGKSGNTNNNIKHPGLTKDNKTGKDKLKKGKSVSNNFEKKQNLTKDFYK